MDLALNNLQRLICHKPQQTKPNQTKQFWRSEEIFCKIISPTEKKKHVIVEVKNSYGLE